MKHDVLTPHHFRRAEAHLSSADPVMAGIIKQVGRCRLATRSARTRSPPPSRPSSGSNCPARPRRRFTSRLLKLFPDGIRRPGPSSPRRPTRCARPVELGEDPYLRTSPTKVLDGTVPIECPRSPPGRRGHRDDDEGEGHRAVVGRDVPDVPAAARGRAAGWRPGIVKAMQRQYRLRKAPKAERMLKIAECWRPYRSVGSWYLWASLDVVPGD